MSILTHYKGIVFRKESYHQGSTAVVVVFELILLLYAFSQSDDRSSILTFLLTAFVFSLSSEVSLFAVGKATDFESRGFESLVRVVAICSSGFALIVSFGLIVFLEYFDANPITFLIASMVVLVLQTPRLLFHWIRAAKSLFKERRSSAIFGGHQYVDYIGSFINKRK